LIIFENLIAIMIENDKLSGELEKCLADKLTNGLTRSLIK